MVAIIASESPVPSEMVTGERLVREALSAETPAERVTALMQAYRLGRPEVRQAMVMAVFARIAVTGSRDETPA